jgi:hypothetical protein
VQVTDLVYKPHLLFIVRYDFNKAAHDVREESNSTKHQENCNESFHVTNGIVVTIPDSGECRECVIAADDKFSPIRNILEVKMSHKSHPVFNIILGVQVIRYHVPKTAYEIRNKERDNHEAEYPIHVHEHVYSDYSFFTLETIKDGLDHFGEAHDIDEFEDPGKSEETKELCEQGLSAHDVAQGEHRGKVYNEGPTLSIIN